MHPVISQAVAAQRGEEMRSRAAAARRLLEARHARRPRPSRRRGLFARVPAAA